MKCRNHKSDAFLLIFSCICHSQVDLSKINIRKKKEESSQQDYEEATSTLQFVFFSFNSSVLKKWLNKWSKKKKNSQRNVKSLLLFNISFFIQFHFIFGGRFGYMLATMIQSHLPSLSIIKYIQMCAPIHEFTFIIV